MRGIRRRTGSHLASATMLGAGLVWTLAGCSDAGDRGAGAAGAEMADPPVDDAGSVSPGVVADGPIELQRGDGSGEPHLAPLAGGGALLTWLEPAEGERWALRMATRRAGEWSEPATIRESDRFFVNWADFPSAVELADGTLVAHWLEKVADATYAYHVRVSSSADGGQTWSEPITVHDDESPTEHGFVSMLPWGDDLAITWLDGRQMAAGEGHGESEEAEADDGHGGGGDMSIRWRVLSTDGKRGPERALDLRTCECCGTAMAAVEDSDGAAELLVAYRDRSPEEIRDIAVVRVGASDTGEPTLVADDGWEIPGCPVNGPQLSAIDARVAIAWYTGAGGEPHVQVAFSEDGGRSFGPAIRVNEAATLGRVDVELIESGDAWVTWMAIDGEQSVVRARRVSPEGARGPAYEIARTDPGRASGFPRTLRLGDEFLFAWTVPGEGGGVRVRSQRLPID